MVDVRLEPMTEERYQRYRREVVDFYSRTLAGGADPDEATVLDAEQQIAGLLSDGLTTPGQHLLAAVDGDQEVGHIWLALTDEPAGVRAFVADLGVRAEARRRGYARAIEKATDRWCRDRGVTEVRASVFAQNPVVLAMAEQAGFGRVGERARQGVVSYHFVKQL